MGEPKECHRKRSGVFLAIGSSNHARDKRQPHDYYATDPKAMELLLAEESFSPVVWECACGAGHLGKVLEAHGHNVLGTDLVYRGYGERKPADFLATCVDDFSGDIITNPPYKYAFDFVRKAIEIVKPGNKVAMFLKLQFLEGKARKHFFRDNPPKTVYVFSSRLICAKNGEFEKYTSSAIAYAWFVWEKGYQGHPIIKWIN